MDNVDLQVFRTVRDWCSAGHRVVLATVTRTWGSAPRPVGSVVAVRGDGQVTGSVSGGCIEDDLIERVRGAQFAVDRPEKVCYGVTGDEAARFGLPCGGSLELVVETITARSAIGELLARLERGGRVTRTLHLADGRVELAASAGEVLVLSDETLVTTLGPGFRLLLIGAGQLTHYLATMALALDYEVMICDPREEYAAAWAVAGATLVNGMPDDAVTALRPDAHTAVVALTHDPKLDDLALMEALRSEAFYVGAIGSQANQRKRCGRLKQHFGLGDAALARLHGPVGLKNGARTPPEIAVSILAEMTAVRYGYRILPPVPPQGRAATEAGCAV